MIAEATPHLSAAWGKTNRLPFGASAFAWLSLTCHCVDVAVTLRELLQGCTLHRLEAAAGRRLAQSDLNRLSVLGLYHDAGKACAGFQNKIIRPSRTAYAGHTGQLLELADRLRSQQPILPGGHLIVDALQLGDLEEWFEDPSDLLDVLVLVASHHGGVGARPSGSPLLEAAAITAFGHVPASSMAELAKFGRLLFPEAWKDASPLPAHSAFWHAFLGLLMLADWVASDARYFPLSGAEQACSRAERAHNAADGLLTSVGFHQPLPRDHPDPVPVLLRHQPLRPVQDEVARVPIEEKLLVIEAPTGEGKTEAALIRFMMLLQAGEIDGLYFALPTRAAGREIHARVEGALRRLWPDALLPPVILAQGGERDDLDLHDEVQSIPWASENTRRFLTAGVAVGTVDQALLSVLRVRHAHLRGAALMRSLLVIDEVHASDPYMAELIATLVQRHLRLGGHVVCLSATLGSSALSLLIDQPAEAFEKARARAYPMISTRSSRLDIKHDPGRERTVFTSIASRTAVIERAATAAIDGARVLWIRSAVDDAIADHRDLVRAGATTLHAAGKPVPHHGRFAPADRPVLDAAILDALGPSQERAKGMVVVATQTAEQSLDIDADLLISDACPPDVLLQRLGRLHRHHLARPTGYERPELILLDPGPLERFLRGGKDLPHGEPGQRWPWVYPNLLAVHEGLRWIAAGNLELPQDCRAMVEAGTHPDHLRDRAAQLGDRWLALWMALYGRDGALRTEARQVLLDWFKPALGQPILSEQVVRSRLGADKVTLMTDFVSPLQRHVEQLHVPGHWLPGPLPDKAEVVALQDEVVVLQAGSLNMRYSSVGLERLI